MSRSRRPAANKKDPAAAGRSTNASNNNNPNNGGHTNGGNRNKGGGKAAKASATNRPGSHTDFWGTPAAVRAAGTGGGDGGSDQPAPVPAIRPSREPDTMVRSLGAPPLAGHEAIAEHYFAAVYEKAAGLAGALAAAGGLLDLDDPTD